MLGDCVDNYFDVCEQAIDRYSFLRVYMELVFGVVGLAGIIVLGVFVMPLFLIGAFVKLKKVNEKEAEERKERLNIT